MAQAMLSSMDDDASASGAFKNADDEEEQTNSYSQEERTVPELLAADSRKTQRGQLSAKKLLDLKSCMQFFLDSSNDVFVIYGLDRGCDKPHYVYANSTALKVVGFGPDDLDKIVGLTNAQIMDGARANDIDDAVLKCFRTGERVNIVHPVNVPGHSEMTYDSVYNLVDDFEGPCSNMGTKFVLGVCRDITKRVEAERKTRIAQAQAEEATNSKSLMVARMSHDLRTPLVGVLNAAELLQQSDLNAEQMHLTGLMTTSSRLLLALANDITDISSIEQGQLSVELVDFDLHTCLNECIDIVRLRAEEGGVRLALNEGEALPTHVIQDGVRFRQVLYNLLYNAIKFTPKHGCVTLHARVMEAPEHATDSQNDPSTSWVAFGIEDTGVGIPADVAPKLFQPFSQGVRHHNENISAVNAGHERGTGLGLAISRSLSKLMGGHLKLVRSTLGVGSLFEVALPFTIPSDAIGATANGNRHAQMEVEDLGGKCDFSSLRVLIADDHPVNRIILQKMVQKYSSNIVELVSDGVQAVEMATGGGKPFDLILMDLHMPRLDGMDAVQQIRSILSSRGEESPMITIVTASAMSGDRQACLKQCKADDYLTKPVIKPDFERVLRSACLKKEEAMRRVPLFRLNTAPSA
ncbi:histidine kinase [Pycnococcus provasolii]